MQRADRGRSGRRDAQPGDAGRRRRVRAVETAASRPSGVIVNVTWTALRPHAARILAAALVGALAVATIPAAPTEGERAALSAQFSFARHELPVPIRSDRTIRAVHPSLERIAAWISS